MRLSREIRFALTPPAQADGKQKNSWAGWPSTNLLVPHLTLSCEIEGEVGPDTGYLCNIKVIDQLLREILIEGLIPKFIEPGDFPKTAEWLLVATWGQLIQNWDHPSKVISLRLRVSPFLSYAVFNCPATKESSAMSETKAISPNVHVTQQFEFSAAHRLHCEDFSDEQNKSLFGKCNNPAGHGHNYVLEVTVSPAEKDGSDSTNLHELESVTKSAIIDVLDHKHLNRDIEYFSNVNPTVENIAVVIFDWLAEPVERARMKLEKVRLYETPKTWAEYSGS